MFFVYAYLFVFAICVGSFLNVVIYRLPNGKGIAKGRSHCFSCNENIKAIDLIPILSYILLGGKCRNCKEKISIRYLLVELLTGLVCLHIFYVNGLNLMSIAYFLFSAILIAISFIDIDTQTIPDKLNITIAVVSIIFIANNINFTERIIGFFVVSLPMYLLTYAIDGAFGGGDIKLMAVCGIILGYKNIMLAFFIGAIIGGVYASYLLIKKTREKHMPFGQFLCVGCYISLLYGTNIIDWYLSFFYI